MHSPTLTSTKFWPGSLGKTANHAMLQAQTYVKGRHVGIQTFLVPLRDFENHRPFHGIAVGDIGPKLDFSSSDNGFLRLSNYKIPRKNMLMRYA